MASSAVYLAVAALIGVGIVLLAAIYRPPKEPRRGTAAIRRAARPSARCSPSIVAGLIWGLFNVGFAMIFSFGPRMLAERGWTITAAGSAISIVLWLSVVSVPLGGFARGPHQASAGHPGRGLPSLCAPDGRAAAQRRGDPDRPRARVDQRPAGRADDEPAGPRAAARRRARSAWACSTPSIMPP